MRIQKEPREQPPHTGWRSGDPSYPWQPAWGHTEDTSDLALHAKDAAEPVEVGLAKIVQLVRMDPPWDRDMASGDTFQHPIPYQLLHLLEQVDLELLKVPPQSLG